MKRRIINQESRTGIILVLPALIVIALLSIYPLLYNLYMTFFDVSLAGDSSFTGLINLRRLLFDDMFWRSLGLTLVYTLGTTLGTTLLGTGAALILNQRFPGRWFVRSLILLPYGAPLISEVFSWQFLFDPVNGIFIETVVERLHIFPFRFNLISSSPILFASLFNIWRYFPFTALFVLSRLQIIDKSLYEAAAVDGAGDWYKFLHITIPEILFIVSALTMIRLIWNFSKFDEVYLLTTNLRTLPVHTYYTAFSGSMEMGLGAALGLIQMVILGVYIKLYIGRVLK